MNKQQLGSQRERHHTWTDCIKDSRAVVIDRASAHWSALRSLALAMVKKSKARKEPPPPPEKPVHERGAEYQAEKLTGARAQRGMLPTVGGRLGRVAPMRVPHARALHAAHHLHTEEELGDRRAGCGAQGQRAGELHQGARHRRVPLHGGVGGFGGGVGGVVGGAGSWGAAPSDITTT